MKIETPEELKKARLSLGLSVYELGDLLHVHSKTIRRWEAEGGRPPYAACVLVSNMLRDKCDT